MVFVQFTIFIALWFSVIHLVDENDWMEDCEIYNIMLAGAAVFMICDLVANVLTYGIWSLFS